MKIAVSCVPFDNGKSGISVYMRNMVRELAALGHELTLAVEPGAEKFFDGIPIKRFIVLPGCCRNAVVSMLYHLFILPGKLGGGKFDFAVIAAGNRRGFAYKTLPVLSVIHDLSQYHITGKYDMFRMFYIKRILPVCTRHADKVLAISRSTADDLVKFWHIAPGRITVCYNGLTLFPAAPSHWCEKNGLTPGKYIFYVSRIEHPGKNHLNLIKAYEKLPVELQMEYKLALAGSDWSGAEKVHAYAESSPSRDRIVFTGYTGNDEMAEAYKGATAYVFPSFFEGFGLSLIEAMHYGVPCAAADASSLGEIGRGAALLFDPADVDDISRALQKLLSEPELRAELADKGRSRAAEFSWAKHAAAIAGAFKVASTVSPENPQAR
ncbi:MAG: glycosyltransferase family 1 protein [Victivallaceae bacterium]|nr:glycosyltransferase family 1 protein [Victivallaceae bacterium]